MHLEMGVRMRIANVVQNRGECSEHCNKHSYSIKGGEFLDELSDYQLRRGSAPWIYFILLLLLLLLLLLFKMKLCLQFPFRST